jgi:acyl-CoA thioesterase YciA
MDGEITLQTLAMPADTNANGDIFGGWLLSQMDLAAGIMAKKISKRRVVTVALNSMSFIRPVHVGDVVTCYAKLIKTGRTSINIQIDVWAHNQSDNIPKQVTSGVFVFVSIDDNGKPVPITDKK